VILALLGMAMAQVAVPDAGGPWAPSGLELLGSGQRLARVDDCVDCHAADAAHGLDSAHGHASLDNPWYLASFQAVRDEVGAEATRHCAGCHDPALLATGALAEPDLGPDHALADRGVTCLTCHGAVAAGPAGNASMTIDLRDLPDPSSQVPAHRARMMPELLTTGAACQGCHRGVLLPEMGAPNIGIGFDDWGAWQGSAWAGTDIARLEADPERASCVDCHHRAAGGGRTALDPDHLLHDAVTLYLPVAWVDGEPRPIDGPVAAPAGAEVVVEAVVWNTGTGHRFPGGLGDTQDVWLALAVDDATGSWTATGPNLRALPLDEAGRPVREHLPHRVALGAFDHTVPPGEAQVLRVGFTAPGGPLRLDASLWHRPHRPELADAACEVSGGDTLDGCAELPTTRVTEARPLDAEAFYALALGRSRGRSEDLAGALWALERAEAAGLDPGQAAVVRARVLGRQGRVDEALAAVAGLPAHPAVAAARGEALAAVWRFDEAGAHWAEAVAGAPLSAAGWAELARMRGSLGEDRGALQAAQRGLALAPRHPELLRSQALAAGALGLAGAGEAEAAWLAHRPPDGADRLRMRCDREDAECGERGAIPLVWVGPRAER